MSSLINRFEDLKVWKDARILVKEVYTLTSAAKLKTDFSLKDQLQRSCVSILSNIAEGFERHNNKEFIRFLTYSKGSAGELRAQLYISLDLGYVSQKEFDYINNKTIEVSMQLSGFIKYLKS